MRPKVLVANDDGIEAPGLQALVGELVKANVCDVYVCAPSGERSAQSHAITLGRYLSCAPFEVPGAVAAYAVDGTPADSVMLALHSPLLGREDFDLVVSGINRGDNCGLHVVYSGTVGAAREAACKGVPAIALSLDNHMARRETDYALSASLSISVIKAALGLLPNQQPQSPPCKAFTGSVININFPVGQGQSAMLQGFHLTHQSTACVFPAFKEVQEATGPHLPLIDEHTPKGQRVFRNYAGHAERDDAEGGDAWAVRRGWVSVCPLGLRQDLCSTPQSGVACGTSNGANSQHEQWAAEVFQATAALITAAAIDAGVAAAGIQHPVAHM